MRIHIVAIGRARSGPEAALFKHYADRVTQWPITLVEQDLRRRTAPDRIADAEAAVLQQSVPAGALVIALDERGRQHTSREFAQLLSGQQDEGRRDIAFLIGGADGLAASVREGAARVLSLGQATWPHLLVRGLLAEQIYRAQQILSGHPYHRD
ncbi:MAG: 23S rRNA (pseudouridine(1915)-N(3))-methyltransferase RlmH [Alphaproteobacteria bacterium]|nr:23S rRNA (pseudouridine(1915)-N(3))-methyltransferase RlmH [Alphaproteobacteria bacterium]